MQASLLGRLCLSVFAVLMTYGVLEAVSLATGVLEPQEKTERRKYFIQFLRPDDRYGFRVRESLRGLRISWLSDDVSMTVDTDAKGFRNVGYDYDKARAFIIGDSFTFGSWVARDQTFFGQLGKSLGEPVMSLGIGGYGMVEYGLLAEDYVPKRPALVMVGIFANDLTLIPESFSAKHRAKPSGYYYGPVGVWERYIVPSTLWEVSLTNQLSTAVTKLFTAKGRAQAAAVSQSQRPASDGTILFRKRGSEATYLSGGHAPAIEQRLRAILALIKSWGGVPLVVFFPSKESAYISEYARLFPDTLSYLNVERDGYKRMADLAAGMGVATLDLTPAFRAAVGKRPKLYFRQDNHWSPEGHKLAAEVMAPVVKRMLTGLPARVGPALAK
ncbi:MAG: SGNH/GDSL hydrolase family protein [Hyphomicrobiaceae bacterium]|nr:SGNH/GDSL hydrolase family protein [Hyphomicrobiaceae bacterium]